MGFETGPSACEANALSTELLELWNNTHLKATAFLPKRAINSYLYRVVDRVKCFVVSFAHFNNSLQSGNVLISQKAKRYKH